MPIQQLANGLRILVVPRPDDNSVTVELCGLAGSGYEGPAAGAAHFLEHLLFDGTENYPEINKLDEIVNSRGSRKNGMTSRDYVRYFVKSLPEEIESSFVYLSEVLLRPLLREHDIEREKTIIEQEINRFKDDPSMYLPRRIYSLFYPGTALGRFVTGDVDDLKRLNGKNIKTFWQNHYCAKNFVMVIAGNVEADDALKLAEKYFSTMPAGSNFGLLDQHASTARNVSAESRDVLKQTHFYVGFPAPSNSDEDSYAMEVTIKILSRGFGSRLYNKLRVEQAMIYSLRGVYGQFGFGGLAGLATAVGEERLNEALAIVRQELGLIAREPVTDVELSRGKSIASSDALFNKELNEEMTFSCAYDLLTLGEVVDPITAKKKYSSVTKEDIMRVSKQVFLAEPKVLALTKGLPSEKVIY